MERNIILQSRKEIYNHLDNKHLKQAFIRLREFIKPLTDWHYQEKAEELETAYQYMLRYMGDGLNDPDRDKLYRKLLSDTYKLTDIVTDVFLQKSDSSIYYSKRRVFLSGADSLDAAYKRLENEYNNLSLAELVETDKQQSEEKKKIFDLERKAEDALIVLFNAIWTNFNPTPEERLLLQEIFSPVALSPNYQANLISALTLSLLHWYDESKLFLLMDLTSSENEILSQRALVGLLLIIQIHSKRALTTSSVENRLSTLLENDSLVNRIRTIQMQLIRTRETERITRKLNDEILPEMMKMAPPLYNKIKTDDLLNDSGESDMNPEWEDFIEKAGIGDKLKEISELQMEGSDVLMSAFSNLKTFPFFQHVSNWFLPFFKENSALTTSLSTDKQNDLFFGFISKSRFMCNSDKYSFCLSLSQMPEIQRSMMLDQFSAQGEELEQLSKMDDAETPLKKTENISNLYIQDLYRFFKLHPQHIEFEDPFNKDILLFRNPLLKSLFSDIDTLHLLGEMFFRKQFYQDAISVYRDLTQLDHSNSEFFQKLGYCYQSMGAYEKAISAYKQADIIHPDSTWTLRRLALCFRNLKKPAEALSYYERFN
ncbi:MAG: tetratricopeptide repeat protein, partial [Bacteroidales bacterium]